MTIAAGAGAGAGQGAGAGAGAGAGQGQGGQGGGASLPEWAKGLPAELQSHPSVTKFKDPSEVFKSYIEVEKHIGKDKIVMPGPNAGPEEWAQVWDKLGRPKSPDEYAVQQMIQNVQLPEGFELDVAGFQEFAKVAHGLGINSNQMKGIIEFYAGTQGKAFQDLRAGQEKEVNDAETSLRKEWGLSYEQNRGIALKTLNVMYGKDAQRMADKYGHDPEFVKGLHAIGTKLSEDVLGEGGARSYTMTPEQAQGEIKKIQSDLNHPVWNSEHPEHAAAVVAYNNLYAQAFPGQTDND